MRAELPQGLHQFFVVRGLAVPAGLIFHEADAFALDRVGENQDGPVS